MKQVTIEILPDGTMKLGAQGFKGAECKKATKALEEALGVVKDRRKTPEAYQVNVTRNTQSH